MKGQKTTKTGTGGQSWKAGQGECGTGEKAAQQDGGQPRSQDVQRTTGGSVVSKVTLGGVRCCK